MNVLVNVQMVLIMIVLLVNAIFVIQIIVVHVFKQLLLVQNVLVHMYWMKQHFNVNNAVLDLFMEN